MQHRQLAWFRSTERSRNQASATAQSSRVVVITNSRAKGSSPAYGSVRTARPPPATRRKGAADRKKSERN
eukprot:2848410-Heterocapsa_arctica.AAC.1